MVNDGFSMGEGQSGYNLFIIFMIIVFRAATTAYEGSQARGRIRATAAGLCHSHSNTGSELHL